MVDCLRILLLRIVPASNNLQNKEIEFIDEMGIDDPAFEVGETLCNQRRSYIPCWHLRQAKFLELIDIATRAVANACDCFRQFQRRNGDHTLLRRPQRGKAVIGIANDTIAVQIAC